MTTFEFNVLSLVNHIRLIEETVGCVVERINDQVRAGHYFSTVPVDTSNAMSAVVRAELDGEQT